MTSIDISEFRSAFDTGAWEDLGPHFTCNEAEAMAALLEQLDCGDMAVQLMTSHIESDEPGDAHYSEDGLERPGYDPERDDFEHETDTPADYEGDRYT